MFKKSLIIGSVTLVLLTLLALTGCSNPTDPGVGPQGGPAPLTLEGAITNGALEQHFTDNDVIRLISASTGTTTVNGTVGAGKTLEIAGHVEIDGGLSIASGGVVNILEDGTLDGKTNGVLDGESGGALSIDGDLVLSYDYAKGMFGEGWPAGVSFGPNGAIDLDDEGTNAHVDFLFSKGIPAVVSSAITALGGTEPDIPGWVGGQKTDPVRPGEYHL